MDSTVYHTTYKMQQVRHVFCSLNYFFEIKKTIISPQGVQHYVIKFVSDLQHVSGFLRLPPPIKLTRYDITEILLKVALNPTKQNQTYCCVGDIL
jgi:hypothetical protein